MTRKAVKRRRREMNEVNKNQEPRDLKKEMAWKNNFFARYMLLRYSLALFFFANLYWLMILAYQANLLLILPLVMVMMHALGSAEQFKLYGQRKAVLTKTRLAFRVQAVVSILVILMTFSPFFTTLFPIFADNLAGRAFVLVFQLLGLITIKFNLARIQQILNNKDKFYYRFQNHIEKYI